MTVYYNDADPAACAWLRELIAAGLLPAGEVDARSILDVEPADLRGYAQCHFFAGIGGWPYALRLAGVPEDLSVWTGSPPCQPFSQAGKRKGQNDDRHLAPAFLQLVAACRPELVFGEQVASAAVLGKAMSGMRKAEADRLIQKAQQRWLPARLQRLRERIREEKADGARRGGAQAGICEATPANTQGARVDSGRETQGEGKGVGLFAELEGHSETNRRGPLRSDWDTVRFDLAESVERSVPGSDCSGRGVYAGKHEGGALRAEHDGERLGVAGRDAGCGGAPAETLIGYISRNIDEADAELEETAQWAWIDHLFVHLERAGYACGACSSPACSAGAPHIRQRLFFGAVVLDPAAGRLGDGLGAGSQGRLRMPGRSDQRTAWPTGLAGGLADGDGGLARHGETQRGREHRCAPQDGEAGRLVEVADPAGTGATDGVWRDPDWLLCRDGRWRPVEPGTFPLADGISGRMGLLRGYGNAIVPPLAAEFVSAFLESLPEGL